MPPQEEFKVFVMTLNVFISYRRSESRYQARDIYTAFLKILPPENVFMDTDTIPPGVDFVQFIEDRVNHCEVLLALICRDWADSLDPATGQRRLDNPQDFVRVEIRAALDRGIQVVPILLDGAAMPSVISLPDDLKKFVRKQAEFVEYRTFDVDVKRLIKRLLKSQDENNRSRDSEIAKIPNRTVDVPEQDSTKTDATLLGDLHEVTDEIEKSKSKLSAWIFIAIFAVGSGIASQFLSMLAWWMAINVSGGGSWVSFFDWYDFRYSVTLSFLFNWQTIAVSLIAMLAALNIQHNGRRKLLVSFLCAGALLLVVCIMHYPWDRANAIYSASQALFVSCVWTVITGAAYAGTAWRFGGPR